jgi:hypothetical protein
MRLGGVFAVGVLLLGPSFSAEASDSPVQAVCTMVWKAYFSPGFTMTKGPGVYGTGAGITGAEMGLITCAGVINGHRVTGPGTFGHNGRTWDGDCFGNQGAGTYSFTVPTSGGVQHVTGTYTESRGINQEGPVEARAPGAFFYGRHQVLPTGVVTSWEDCRDRPVTEVDAVMVGYFEASDTSAGSPAEPPPVARGRARRRRGRRSGTARRRSPFAPCSSTRATPMRRSQRATYGVSITHIPR